MLLLIYRALRKVGEREVNEPRVQAQLEMLEEGTGGVISGVPGQTGAWVKGKIVPVKNTGPVYHMVRSSED